MVSHKSINIIFQYETSNEAGQTGCWRDDASPHCNSVTLLPALLGKLSLSLTALSTSTYSLFSMFHMRQESREGSFFYSCPSYPPLGVSEDLVCGREGCQMRIARCHYVGLLFFGFFKWGSLTTMLSSLHLILSVIEDLVCGLPE